jgi:hypothetical protein
MDDAATALHAGAMPGIVDHDLAHRTRRQREEVPPVVDSRDAFLAELEVQLADQCRRRQRRARCQRALPARAALELIVDELVCRILRRRVAGVGGIQKLGDFDRRRHLPDPFSLGPFLFESG